ncbi:MAG: 6-phosphogluconolactonase [Solirubrobacteraceae bacterium]|nr:6-phosphogluconolactonase [Solirubrobacteraceae bacterium]
MTGPVVSRCADAEEAARRAAEVLATTIDAARTVRGAAHVALSGGSTVGRVYELLGPLLPEWSDVHLWYGDERCVPLDDAESNHRLATTHLQAPGATWHPVPTHLGCDAAAAAYAAEIADVVLDVALNGMGPDGHTASLFPGFPQVRQEGVCLAVHGSPKPPPDRVTLTLSKLNESRRIVLLVTGAEKAPMLARVLAGPDPEVPASLLARDALEIVADAAALDG